MANELRFRASIKDDVSGPLGRIKDKFGQIQKQGAKPFLQGLAIGGGIAAFNSLGTAIEGVTGFLSDSIGKAREEQAGIARLDQALSANVKGWDGNRDAIEKVISEREKLAFSDGEQRDSLALLVARTHDVTQALALQRTAMDLARLKGIDLATASGVIGKVYSGNVSVLQRYGIAVAKGASATDALAQVQKAAGGQADTFANTTEGSMQSLVIAFDDLQEEIGTALLPVLKDLSVWLRDDMLPVLQDSVKWVEDNKDAFGALGDLIPFIVKGPMGGALDFWKNKQDDAAQAAQDAAIATAGAWDTGSERIGTDTAAAADALKAMGSDATKSGKKVTVALDKIVWKAKDVREELGRLGSEAADAYFDPLITQAELAADKREIAEQRAIVASKKSTKEQVADAQQRLLELNKDVLEKEVALIGYGKMNAAAQKKFLADLRKKWSSATGEAKDDIAALIRFIERIPTSRTITITTRNRSTENTNDHRAGGGPVSAGKAYIVGEKGEELFTPSTNGFIVSNDKLRASVGGSSPSRASGGGMTLNLTVNNHGLLTPGAAQAIAAAIEPIITRAQQQRGIVPRR